MKTLVIYYSYTGHTRAAAQAYGAEEAADILEIKDVRRSGKLKAYSRGCFAALRGKGWPIQPLETDFAAYDTLALFSPVWASNPPPAVNAMLAQWPEGKTAAVRMVSASGKSSCRERIETLLKQKNCDLVSFEDIKA